MPKDRDNAEKDKKKKKGPYSKTHQPSAAARHEKANKRSAKLKKRHKAKMHVDKAPTEFKRLRNGNTAMRDALHKLLPDTSPETASIYPRDCPHTENVVFRYVGPTSEGLGPHHTRKFLSRFVNVIPKESQLLLLEAWRELVKTKPVPHCDCPKKDATQSTAMARGRSETPALHLGIWKTNLQIPAATTDTHLQTPECLERIFALLRLVQSHLVEPLERIMERDYPHQLERARRVYNKVIQDQWCPYAGYPECDFRGPFYTVAVKEGSSELLHLDWNDHPDSITWVVPIWDSEWEGGDLWVPQANARLSTQSGDALAFSSRHLAHAGTKIIKGNCLVFTLFTDRGLFDQALASLPPEEPKKRKGKKQ